MRWPPDETIWLRVKQHAWKYRTRPEPVRLILMHATRGLTTMAKQYGATINWSLSPNNIVHHDGGEVSAGIASKVISDTGQLCQIIPDEWHPTWSAGHMDPIAVSYELAQPAPGSAPFTEACLDRAAYEVAKDCLKYNIPPVVLSYVSGDNHQAPGIARHDHSANGDYYGKSDPGSQFDDRAFEARVLLQMEALMPEKTLTREQYISICKAEDKEAEETRKKVRQYVFALNGWARPSEVPRP